MNEKFECPICGKPCIKTGKDEIVCKTHGFFELGFAS